MRPLSSPHVFAKGQSYQMPYNESKYFTPTKPQAEWMRTLYSTPPLPATPPPSPACWQSPKCQTQLQYSPVSSLSMSYCQSQCLQRQNTPVMPSSPGYHAGQYNQAQKIQMSPSSTGYYAGEYNSLASLNSNYQHYGLWDQYQNSMVQSPSPVYQHNSPCLQQQSALRSSPNSNDQNTLHSSYDHQYAGTQSPGMTSSYWSAHQNLYQCQNPAPPANTGCEYAHQYPLQFQSSPKIPVDSPAQHEPPVNTLITPVSSVQDLDKIILDFEMGYSSPRKKDNVSPVGAGKFVKKMVAALEHKYSAQTSKSFPEFKSRHNSSKDSKNSSTQKSFNETFISGKSGEKTISSIKNHQQKPINRCLDDTFILEDNDNLDMELKTGVQPRFKPDPDPNPELESKPEPQPQPQQKIQIQDSIPIYMDTEIVLRRKRASEPPARSDSFNQMPSAPKIVAAKLKTPIEFDDDTEIEWIPVTNQKLPRKNSFKKLLTLLTGKKNPMKGSKFFCNLNKSNAETKSSQRDSGYVEKSSSSSSSLSSQGSTKVPKQHSNLSSFQQPSEDHIQKWFGLPSEENNMIVDDKLFDKNKILFKELDRDEVRVSLGPLFPARAKNIFTDIKRKLKENNMRSVTSNPPKASKKSKDLINSSTSSITSSATFKTPLISSKYFKSPSSSPKSKSRQNSLVKQDLDDSYKSFDEGISPPELELPSPIWEFLSSNNSNSTYNLKNDWSQSEPQIFSVMQSEAHRSSMPDYDYNNMIYDVPRSNEPGRPKSSIYEEALSVKRRTESFDSSSITATDNYFVQQNSEEASINLLRPKVLLSQQILSSMAQDEASQLRAPYLVNSLKNSR
ncbi:hypothetical protein KQX54_012947 [Cotesia glomerata]|uniref:Uncharacterized protein n=1 Tax=Cotesia glomerata TaxID=32391 RepID=A0AAV7J0U7_COTGL|nr:hypothetical protein KQX54_012947 [Cotesia glomerata]